MDVLAGIFTVIQIISALFLIVLVMLQTTKSEGLTGTIGGKASATFRGKPGIDDKLAEITRWSAVGFMLASFLVYYIKSKLGAV